MSKKSISNLFFVITIFLIDRLSKYWAIKNLTIEEKFEVIIFPYLSFNLIWNDGIAFGLFSFSDKYLYNILTAFIILVTTIIFYFLLKTKGIEKYSFMMIFSGSLGNIFDRLFYSAVPDFIDIHYENFHWFIFNVADIFITIGVMLLILNEIVSKKNK
jgi:signal peptidase II